MLLLRQADFISLEQKDMSLDELTINLEVGQEGKETQAQVDSIYL